MYITEIYKKFGFEFDHIYAFEINEKKPTDVYERVPEYLMASYHWINVGVSPEQGNKYNPWSSILRRYTKDDFIVVKLDVDNSAIENRLAHQLLENTNLTEVVDQFYFEHHVSLAEMKAWWRRSMSGSIHESLQLFHDLREKGVAAHFWP